MFTIRYGFIAYYRNMETKVCLKKNIRHLQCTSDFTNYTFYELRDLRTSSISPFRTPILVIQIKTDFTNFGFYELRNLRTAFMVPLSVYLC